MVLGLRSLSSDRTELSRVPAPLSRALWLNISEWHPLISSFRARQYDHSAKTTGTV